MEFRHVGRLFFTTISEDTFPRDTICLRVNRNQGAMCMRVDFIKVYIETDDVLFAIFVCHEPIHILCPFLDVLLTGDTRVVCSLR